MEKQQSVRQPVLSPQEWESLIDDFGSGVPSRRERWLHLPLLDLALLALLRRDFPASLKPLLLLFIEDSHPILASPPSAALPPLIDALRSLLAAPAGSDPHASLLREQFMATATSVALSVLDAPILDFSSAPQLDSLVELLLTVVNRPNHGPDRQSRAAACECLRELEASFPCLLSDAAGHLWTLAQAERTHAAQSYLLLLATVVQNIVLHGLLSSANPLSTSITLVPFNAPNRLFSATPETSGAPSDLNLREIKRVLAFLWERPHALTPAATMKLVSILSSIAGALEQHVPAVGALLKVQFSGLIYSYDPILCHAVLMLYSRFPDAFTGDDGRSIARRLALMAKEAQQPLVFRLLALHWLLGSPRLSNEDWRPSLTSMFYPSVFDPLAVKAKKLDALASIAAGMEVSVVEKKGEADEGRKEQMLELLEDALACVSSFKWLPPWSTETSVAFRMLHKFLVELSPHCNGSSEKIGVGFLADTVIFGKLQSMMVNLASHHRILVPAIAAFVDRLLGCKAHRQLGELLLQNLDEHLLPKLELDYGLASYFPIFERIAKNHSIPPRGLVELLSQHVVSLMKKHSPDTWLSSWSQGTKVLGICRMMLKHHYSSRVFLPLSRLLALICQSFPDLEVRDNARVYLRMLVCIPGKKLRQILTLGEQPSIVSPSPHPGLLFQVASSSHSEDIKNSGSVSSYMFFRRVTPLLVKQSWALVLPEPSTRDGIGASYVVDANSARASSSADVEREGVVSYERISLPQEPLRVMDSKNSEILAVLRRHFSCIPDYRHMSAIKIRIPCMLWFDSEQFSHVWGTGPSTSGSEELVGLPAIYATTINFSSTAKYGSIPPCRVPFLLGEPSKDKNAIVPVNSSSDEDLSYRASVVMVLEPREPMPGLIDVIIKTNAEDGRVISGRLQSISVGIEDMFLKGILPPDIEEDEKPEYYFDLFHALWEACGNSANTGRETFPLSGGKGAAAIYGTQSVKLLEVFHRSLISTVEKYLSSFVVGVIGHPLVEVVRENGIIRDVIWEDNEDDLGAHHVGALVPYSDKGPLPLSYFEDRGDTENVPPTIKKNMGTIFILLFLPPRFHLLLQMEVSMLSTLVRIRTDHWQCLAYIDEYLETLFLT